MIAAASHKTCDCRWYGGTFSADGSSSDVDTCCSCNELPATVTYTLHEMGQAVAHALNEVAIAAIASPDDEQYLAWLDLCCWLDRIEWRVRRQMARHGNDDVGTEQVTLVITPRNRGPPACLPAAPFVERNSQRRGFRVVDWFFLLGDSHAKR